TLAVSLIAGLLFGAIPAWQGSRLELNTALKESAGRTGTGFRQNRARGVLVISEIALALVLLIGSALLIRTELALRGVQPGFDAEHVLTMRMSLTGPRFATSGGVEQLIRTGVETLSTLPGVEVVSATCCVPLAGGYGLPFLIIGRPTEQGPYTGGGG